MKSKTLFKHSTIYAAGNIIRQLVGFVMLPIYTQYLTPTDYGVVGLLMFMISVVEGLFGARLGEAMPKFYFEQEAEERRKTVISTAMLVTGGVSVIVSIILISLGNLSSQLIFDTNIYSIIISMFGIQILTNALESQALIYIRIQQRPMLFISFTFLKLVLQLSLNLWFVVHLEMGLLGVAIGSVTASCLIALVLSAYSFYHSRFSFDTTIARRMIKFSWPLWISGMASLYVSSANRYYIQAFSSLQHVGLYELAARFGFVITSLVYRPFASYWDTERFNIYKQDNAKSIYQTTFILVCLVLTISTLFVSIFSDTAIKLMSAPAFHTAALAVPLLTVGGFARCLTDYCNFSFFVTEKTIWINKIYYFMAIVVTVFYLALIPGYGFVGAAAAAMLGEVVQFLVIFYVARRQYDMELPLSPLLAMAVIGTTGYYAANWLLASPDMIVDIALKSVVFIIFTLLLLGYTLLTTSLGQTLASRLPAMKFVQRFRSPV